MTVDQLAFFEVTGDAAARAAIREQLGETMFVEAGAGTGKTKALVGRIVELVTSDAAGTDANGSGLSMRSIAAITFTEKAAAELRDRVRRELEGRARSAHESVEVRARCAQAVEDLDAAAICTLHSFAQRLLTEFPIEAGLPPRVDVLDEIASGVAFATRWRQFVDRLLEVPEMEQTILLAFAAGIRLVQLRAVAEIFNDNWDLLERVGEAPPLPDLAIDAWLREVDALCARQDQCIDPDDKMAEILRATAARVATLRAAPDELDRIRLLREFRFKHLNWGRKENWRCDIEELRARAEALITERDAFLEQLINAAVRQLAVAIAGFTGEEVARRRRAGELEFHDLLVLARELLRDPRLGARVRARLRARYRRLLIDEFQDTDPIQVELAVLLASTDPDGDKPWTDQAIEPGRLFFVGDPKQSIYRFRRADIATFLAARDRFVDAPLLLTCNFRTTAPVLEWINLVFGDLIQAVPGSQPEYVALDAARDDIPAGAPVTLLGIDPHDDQPDADTLRDREAADVVAAIRAVLVERWQISDRGTHRDARLGDIAILLPARTSLGFLERALTDAGIPYRAETSSLVYGSREVRDIMAALRAVDDPSDQLALVTALRSPLFGCGDDDLYEYHVEHRGRWDVRAPAPATLPTDHPVVEGIAYLATLHEARTWTAPSELLERLVRDRFVLELGIAGGRFRDIARRVRFIVDQARAFAETAGGGLRDYLAWVALQAAEGARVVETVLPETDDDAVRILTIHGAKGLEFPIVIGSGMTTAAAPRRGGVEVLFPPSGRCEIRLGKGLQTDEFELHKPIDEQMGFHEKLRLLYVGCTRARDHLVVSVHRKARVLDADRSRWTHSELLWAAGSQGSFAPVQFSDAALLGGPVPDLAVSAPPRDTWADERAAAFARGIRRRFVAATTLARRADEVAAVDPGLAKDGRDLELPPWNKGRYGTAIGRAVHAVLQTVDLTSGAGLAEAAAAQAAAEGVLGHEATIAALAASALASPSVVAACRLPYWRETYVAVPLDEMTLEGYVDLVYRDNDGLVVVDYKTDAVATDEDLAARLAHYRIQGAAYALAVADATGESVTRCVFCFLDPAGAKEVTVAGPELAAAVAEVRRLVRREWETPSAPEPALPAEL